MFKHILVPTDGSDLSKRAAKAAAELARTTHARITAIHAIEPYRPPAASEIAILRPELYSPEHYREFSESRAHEALAEVAEAAESAGVRCETLTVTDSHPWEAIVNAAKKRDCDLIAMASHGRRGLEGLLIGSETHKVLTHSKVPVFVIR
jgi:nucleotide-binding universal stress UspA family protein